MHLHRKFVEIITVINDLTCFASFNQFLFWEVSLLFLMISESVFYAIIGPIMFEDWSRLLVCYRPPRLNECICHCVTRQDPYTCGLRSGAVNDRLLPSRLFRLLGNFKVDGFGETHDIRHACTWTFLMETD